MPSAVPTMAFVRGISEFTLKIQNNIKYDNTASLYHALALYNFISNFQYYHASLKKKKRKLRLRWSKGHAISHINREVELRIKTISVFFF